MLLKIRPPFHRPFKKIGLHSYGLNVSRKSRHRLVRASEEAKCKSRLYIHNLKGWGRTKDSYLWSLDVCMVRPVSEGCKVKGQWRWEQIGGNWIHVKWSKDKVKHRIEQSRQRWGCFTIRGDWSRQNRWVSQNKLEQYKWDKIISNRTQKTDADTRD